VFSFDAQCNAAREKKMAQKKILENQQFAWYSWVDSNHRPPDPQFCGPEGHEITGIPDEAKKALFCAGFWRILISQDHSGALETLNRWFRGGSFQGTARG
jgi:hypothetical protein